MSIPGSSLGQPKLTKAVTVFFQCRPLALVWDPSVEGTCIAPSNLKFAAFFNSSVAIVTDVLFALLPIPILWNVQMNWKVKSAVAAILSLGIFAAVAAIVKVTFLGAYGQHGDFLWDSADITIWYAAIPPLKKASTKKRTTLPNHPRPHRTTVEINVAIIAASIPCLKPLFKTLLESTTARYYGSNRYKRYAGKYPDDDDNKTPPNAARKSLRLAVRPMIRITADVLNCNPYDRNETNSRQ